MKRLFYLLIGLVLLPTLLFAQIDYSGKGLYTFITTYYYQKTDVYTKTQSDARYPSATYFYSKTESDALLLDKADTDSVYTKTAADILLALKADKTYVDASDEAIITSLGSCALTTYVNATDETIILDLDSAEVVIQNLLLEDASLEIAIQNLLFDNDSQDVQIESNRVAITTKAATTYVNATDETIITDLDSAEAKINDLDIINDSQDVQIESNRVAITLKADSEEIHTDISQAYVNVKEFGAVGDGIVDDAAAINNAIASLTSGGVVLFPSGYYCIKSQITLTSKHGLTLRGVGHGKDTTYLGTNIYATGYNGHHFRGIDCVGVSIENMNLTAEGQDSSFAVGGIYFSISSNSNNPYHTFKDLFISDISNNGISIGTPIMTNFTNVTVRKCVGSSFNLWSGTSTSWTNCYANNATEAGWLLTGMTYCTLQGCAAESAGVGYYFDNSKSISVMGCGTEAIINRGGAFNGYAYRSINGSNAITLYDCYDRISETGSLDESAGGLLDYINHKTDSNSQITKIHSLPASTSTYTDTYDLGVTDVQSALDTIELWLSAIDVTDDSQDVAINAHLIDAIGAHAATAISATWTNVQVSLDSIEAAIQGIVVGSGFATEAWVNGTLETNFYTQAQTNATIEAAIAAIPAPSVNQTVTVTAGEALTAGQVVSLINESGTIKAYNNALTVSTSPNGAESVFNSAATTYCSAVALDSTRFLVAYKDSDTYPKSIVGTVSGSSVSWGSESAAFLTAAVTDVVVCKIDTDRVIAIYNYTGGGQAYIHLLTISGTTITVASTDALSAHAASYISASKLDTDKAVVCFKDGTTNNGNTMIVSYSGTTLTKGTEYEFNAAATAYISVSTLSSTSAIVAYQDGGNSNYGTAQVLSISGTTITSGTEYVFKEETSVYTKCTAISSTKALVADVTIDGPHNFWVATVSEGAISYGTVNEVTLGLYPFSMCTIDSTKVLYAAVNVANSALISILITIDGTDSSDGSQYSYSANGNANYYSCAYLGNNKTAIAYKRVSDDYGTAVVNTWATSSYASVAGISQGAYSSGSDAVVLIHGTDDNQSGLITGEEYYVQTDFTLQTTETALDGNYIKMGIAKDSDSLILE